MSSQESDESDTGISPVVLKRGWRYARLLDVVINAVMTAEV
jgi:hypothetical protein